MGARVPESLWFESPGVPAAELWNWVALTLGPKDEIAELY